MNSVVSLNNIILKKINLLLNIIDTAVDMLALDTEYHTLIHVLKNEYMLNSLPMLILYHNATDLTRASIFLDYELFIMSNGIIDNINDMADMILKVKLPSCVEPYIHEYKQLSIINTASTCIKSTCLECDAELIVRSDIGDLYCAICGYTEKLDGVYIDESNIVIKTGPYKPSKHCDDWVTRIFAMEKTIIPQHVIDSIMKCMERDGVKNRQLTCKLIRDTYLKELHREGTKYNANTPKIRKMITGIAPPQPTAREYEEICRMFETIDQIFVKIKPDGYSSRRYYPHFIRKIIEHVYHDRLEVKNAIIEGIHIQEKKTKESHDILWKHICDASDGVLQFSKTKELIFYR